MHMLLFDVSDRCYLRLKENRFFPVSPCNLRLKLTEIPSSANLLILLDYLLY